MRALRTGSRARRLLRMVAVVATSLLMTAGDWPTYLHDTQRTAASQDETILSPSNVGHLTNLWTFKTGGPIAASAAVVSGTIFVGSWDGYEYALDAATGTQKWTTYLGITGPLANCSPPSAGVTSAATVQNGVVYVGGGDAYWYALDATTGAVLWKVFTGDNSASGGHYNWSSPLIYNGYAYIGVASFGDCPLVQGQLLQVSLSTHQVVNTFNVVPAGQVGGGIWTSPSVDTATNTIYVTTGTAGTADETTQPQAQAIIALDASTLSVKGAWQIPPAQAVLDSDWGSTPLVFDDAAGTHLVAAVNKNGYLYAFDRTNLSAGPLWQQQIAIGGACPQCGQGPVSSGALSNGRLYFAGGNTSINGASYAGSVRALDPATGNYLWEHGTAGPVIPALAYANGFVVDGAGNTLEILDASSGASLYGYATGATLYAPASVSNGEIIVGSTDGNVYAFGLPGSTPTATPTSTAAAAPTSTPTATPTSTPAAAPTSTPTATPTSTPMACPKRWSCADIGAPALAGSQMLGNGTWTIRGSGVDIWNSSDQFHFVWQNLRGNGTISARVSSQTITDQWAKAGLMFRASTAPAAPNYMVEMTGSNGIYVQYRSVQGASSAVVTSLAGTLPVYLRITRSGSTFTAYTSSNGSTWTAVAGSSVTLTMNNSALVGMAVTSHNTGALSTAIFDTVSAGT